LYVSSCMSMQHIHGTGAKFNPNDEAIWVVNFLGIGIPVIHIYIYIYICIYVSQD
jgi:hypothetical protein